MHSSTSPDCAASPRPQGGLWRSRPHAWSMPSGSAPSCCTRPGLALGCLRADAELPHEYPPVAGPPGSASRLAESARNPMTAPFLPFALPEIGEDEIAEVVDTLRSGWITTGPKARRFEDDFSAFLEIGRATGRERVEN